MNAKCTCQNCNGEFEFDASDFQESGRSGDMVFGQSVPCPHCEKNTMVYLNRTDGERTWYYTAGGKRIGPVKESQVRTLIATNVIQSNSSVWSEGMADWTPAYQTEMKRLFTSIQPPPLTGESVNNSIVWILAFAPIISAIIQIFVASSTGQSVSDFWWIALLLNIGLCAADGINLNRAGHKGISGWVILVPVYLFVRAARLKQSSGYAIVWLVTFFLSFFLQSGAEMFNTGNGAATTAATPAISSSQVETTSPGSSQVDNSSQASSPSAAVVAASQPATPAPKVSISDVKGEIQDDGGMDITGIIQNESDSTLDGVTVNFNFLDDDGNKVDESMDFIQKLAPNDTWSFKVSSLKDGSTKYQLDSITSIIDGSDVNLDVEQNP
jgi:hypothetical protein